METIFKVGQKVYDIRYGYGVVARIDDSFFGVKVDYDSLDAIKDYTPTGVYIENECRSLFFAEPEITDAMLNPPWNPVEGEWVLAGHTVNNTFSLRIFIGMDDGHFKCYQEDGITTFSWPYARSLSSLIEENRKLEGYTD